MAVTIAMVGGASVPDSTAVADPAPEPVRTGTAVAASTSAPGADGAVSYAGIWTTSGGSAQMCSPALAMCAPIEPASGVLMLRGACDGVGACQITPVSGFAVLDGGGVAGLDGQCAALDDGAYVYNHLFARWTLDVGTGGPSVDWYRDHELSSGEVVTSGVAGASAQRTAGPAGFESTECTVGTPEGITATIGDGKVTVSWTAPTPATGIIGYEVIGSPHGSCIVLAPGTSCVVSGLTNWTSYTFTVRSVVSPERKSPSSAPSLPAIPRPSPGGAVFADVAADHTFATEIGWMVDEGIASGYADGLFRPVAPVSRQALASFLHKAAGSPPAAGARTIVFSDVQPGHAFYEPIMWMVSEGITAGYADGTFRPTAPVSRQAMASFLYKAANPQVVTLPGTGTFSDVPSQHTFFQQIMWMVSEGITNGYQDGTFGATAPVTRQSASAFLFRSRDAGPPETEVLVSPDTLVVEPTALASVTSVEPDRLVLSELRGNLAGVEPGQVLVAGVSPTTPGGLLRRVDSVTSGPGGVVVETSDAALDEAIEQADVAVSFVIDGTTTAAGAPAGAALADGLGYSRDFSFDRGLLTVSGSYGVSARVDLDLEIDKFPWPSLETAKLTATATVGADIRAEASGGGGTWEERVEIGEVEFGTYTVMVGPVPIVVTPQLALEAEVSATTESNFMAGAAVEGTVSVDVGYDDDDWDTTPDHDLSFSPAFLYGTWNAQAAVTLHPRFGLEFYRTASLSVSPSPYLTFEVDAATQICTFRLDAGLDFWIDLEASILGKEMVDEDFGPIEVLRRTLWEEDPIPGGCGGWGGG